MNLEIKEIFVRRGVQACMARAFGVGRKTVREALAGLTRTDLADRLRKAALSDFGGFYAPDTKSGTTPP